MRRGRCTSRRSGRPSFRTDSLDHSCNTRRTCLRAASSCPPFSSPLFGMSVSLWRHLPDFRVVTAIVAHPGAPRQQANTAVVGFEYDPLHISPKKDWFATSGRNTSRAKKLPRSRRLVRHDDGAGGGEHAADAVADRDPGAGDLGGGGAAHLAHALLQGVHAVHARVHVRKAAAIVVQGQFAAGGGV